MIYKIFGWFFQQPVGGHYASYILLNLKYLTHPDVAPQTHWHLAHWHWSKSLLALDTADNDDSGMVYGRYFLGAIFCNSMQFCYTEKN